MSILYIVATPIGNLKDINFRAIETLKEVDFILAEDTRETLKLLNHYDIKKPVISYFQHSKLSKVEYILGLLAQGKNLALVSDAGIPGISIPCGFASVAESQLPVGLQLLGPQLGEEAILRAVKAWAQAGYPTDPPQAQEVPPKS